MVLPCVLVLLATLSGLGSSLALANDTHRQLLTLPAATRTKALAAVVASSGHSCAGVSSEYEGSDKGETAFWRVDCSNRQSYMVSIANDRGGSTKVLSCAFMRALTKQDDCFRQWSP
jgi:hypothetical protein